MPACRAAAEKAAHNAAAFPALAAWASCSLTGAGTGGYSYRRRRAVSWSRLTACVSPRWPTGQQLSITVIADLHAGGPNMGVERIDHIVDIANGLRSDIVVLLGDYFATYRFVIRWCRIRFGPPSSRGCGRRWASGRSWAITTGGTTSMACARRWPASTFRCMENEAVLLGEAGNRFWLAGIGDQIAYRLGHNRFRGDDDLPGTLARVTTDDPVILLVHEPDIFTKVPSRVALTLAGHTHGGQIRLPFIWPGLVPSAYGARFAYGHIVEDDRQMIVSGGLGTSFMPLVSAFRPEIVQVELAGLNLAAEKRTAPGRDPAPRILVSRSELPTYCRC